MLRLVSSAADELIALAADGCDVRGWWTSSCSLALRVWICRSTRLLSAK